MSYSPSKRALSVFLLAMLNVSIMASLRNLPLVASYGLGALLFFALVALFFLLPCALVSAELATGWPKEGGVYVWVREALGDRWGFVAIWMQWIHNISWYPVIMSFIAVTAAYLYSHALAENRLFVMSVVLIGFWGITLLNYLGIKTSSLMSTIGVICGTILPGLFIIFLGVSWVAGGHPVQTPLNWEALLPPPSHINHFVFLAGLFLAFAGLEVSASYANCVENPRKNYPRAILLGALITFVLFMLGSLAIAVVVPKGQIDIVEGLMAAFKAFLSAYHLLWLLPVMALLMIVGALAEVNSWVIGPLHGLFATAFHGDLPPFLQKRNRRAVPTRLLFFQAILVSIVSLIFLYMPEVSSAFWMLTALSAQSYLVMYVLLFLSAIRLRYLRPTLPRPYRIPFKNYGIWVLCCMGSLASIFAFVLCFFTPSSLKVGDHLSYALLLLGGLVVMFFLPLFIQSFRKREWILRE